jgi:putative ABC transport system permease protein
LIVRSLPFDYAVTSLLRKPLRSVLATFACALATLLVLGALAFAEALDRSFTKLGRDDVAIVLSVEAENDTLRSEIPLATTTELAANVRGIRTIADRPLVSGEVTMGLDVRVGADRTPRPSLLRGVTDTAFLLHPAVSVTSGRAPTGFEAIVGRLAERRLGLDDGAITIGSAIDLDGHLFTVSGRFEAPGSALEAEIWMPLAPLLTATRRDSLSCVFVQLESAADFAQVQLFCKKRLDLELEALRSSEFFAALATYFRPIRELALAMASLIAFAAFLTASSTLAAVVRERRTEFAALRAIGFEPLAITLALLLESAVIGAAGGLLGALVGRLVLADATVAVAMGAISLDLSSRTIAAGFLFAALSSQIAVLPALVPTLRRPIALELRQD